MPTLDSDSPRPTPKPLFKVLGWHQVTAQGYIWYWIEVHGIPRRYRAQDLIGLGTLLQILPEIDHWRRTFPNPTTSRKGGVDTRKAGGWLMAEAERVGRYEPEAQLMPDANTFALLTERPQPPVPRKFRKSNAPWRKGERATA